MLTHGSLFSGIGGFDFGFERVGIKTLWQVECDPYCLKVLEKHWPCIVRRHNVRKVHREGTCSDVFRCDNCLIRVDIISAGWPCQPASIAGKRRGTADDRWLWPETHRVVKDLLPRWFVGENVAGFSIYLDTVLADLEAINYEARAVSIPACAVGAWHPRQRWFIVAHRNERHHKQPDETIQTGGTSAIVSHADVPHANQPGLQRKRKEGSARNGTWWSAEPRLARLVHGISGRLYRRERIQALGNAIIPQIAVEIGRMILSVEAGTTPEGT